MDKKFWLSRGNGPRSECFVLWSGFNFPSANSDGNHIGSDMCQSIMSMSMKMKKMFCDLPDMNPGEVIELRTSPIMKFEKR